METIDSILKRGCGDTLHANVMVPGRKWSIHNDIAGAALVIHMRDGWPEIVYIMGQEQGRAITREFFANLHKGDHIDG